MRLPLLVGFAGDTSPATRIFHCFRSGNSLGSKSMGRAWFAGAWQGSNESVFRSAERCVQFLCRGLRNLELLAGATISGGNAFEYWLTRFAGRSVGRAGAWPQPGV